MEKACHLVAGLVKRCEMSSHCPCGLKCYLHFNFFGSYSNSSVTCGQQSNVDSIGAECNLVSWCIICQYIYIFFGLQLLPIDCYTWLFFFCVFNVLQKRHCTLMNTIVRKMIVNGPVISAGNFTLFFWKSTEIKYYTNCRSDVYVGHWIFLT